MNPTETMNENPPAKKLLLFNASALKEMVCPQRAFNTILEGYKEKVEYNDTFYGTCYHKYQSVLAETSGNFPKAMKEAEALWRSKEGKITIRGKKDFLNLQYLRCSCVNHFNDKYPLEDFDIAKQSGEDISGLIEDKNKFTPLVEVQFHVPYYSDSNIDVVLTGTIDKIGKFKNGAWAIGDYKTTSTWDWRDYLERYKMSAQLRFYLYLLKSYARMYPDSIFNEICKTNQVGAFIDGVFLSSTKPTEYRRSEVFFFKDEEMEDFERMMHGYINSLIAGFKKEYVMEKTGIMTGVCTSIYGKRCPYYDACSAPNETIAQHVLNNNFVKAEYGLKTYGGGE